MSHTQTDTTPAAIEALLQGAQWQEPENLRRYLFPTFAALAAELTTARAERDEALLREAALLANNEDERKTLIRHNARHASELAALRKEVERLTQRKKFPILGGGGATIDLQLVIDHGGQARKNHYQSVTRLAERGGLSWEELFAVLHNRPWEKIDTNEAMFACRALEAKYLAAALTAEPLGHGITADDFGGEA